MGRLDGKVALVTGGSSGIGLATAKAFVNEGARVVITGRNGERLKVAQCALGDDALAVRGDVTDSTHLDDLFRRIAADFGRLDILFANAGVVEKTRLGSTSEEAFDRIMNLNVKGVFFTVQKSIGVLRRGASIILNASVARHAGTPQSAVYAASKAAVRALARNFSAALAPRGIRVNVVSPGPIRVVGRGPLGEGKQRRPSAVSTPAGEGIRASAPGRVETRNPWLLSIPLGRYGTPDDVAHAVVFLASDESGFMAGAEIVADGGRTQLPDGAPVYRALAGDRRFVR